MNFYQIQTDDDDEPQYVYMRDPQHFEPVGESPIRQRMEILQQGNEYDTRPYMAPRARRGSPLRRRLIQAMDAIRSQLGSDPTMNMPVTGR